LSVEQTAENLIVTGEYKEMFKGIPEKLTEGVRELPLVIRQADRDIVYYGAAGCVIAHYLGMILSDAHTRSISEHPLAGDLVSYRHSNRVILIGESLFRMRFVSGFEEICRRLKTRNLRSVFFEMIAAKKFVRAGYDIAANPETGVKGDDFDFVAVKGEEKINVEVTALTAPAFSVRTVSNALKTKRKQVPNTAPAVIFCVVPETWAKDGIDLDAWLSRTASAFLATTQRINLIVFLMEQHVDQPSGGSGGALLIGNRAYANPKARFPIADSSFLSEGITVQSRSDTGDVWDALQGIGNDGEFFRWVDELVPATSRDDEER
jgi:hypothetical protein